MGVGLLAGAAAVNYETGLGDLALMGAITGIPFGAAQALVLAGRGHVRGPGGWRCRRYGPWLGA
jgi:hypothetical protein